MLQSTAYSFLIVSSCTLHGMEQENKESLISWGLSIASSIIDSLKITPKLVKPTTCPKQFQLSNILKIPLKDLQKLSAGTTIEVTPDVNQSLLEWLIIQPCSNPECATYGQIKGISGYLKNNNEIKASINPDIYTLRKDSYFSRNYKFSQHTSDVSANAYHLELYKILKLESLSIFKPCICAKTTGYDLDILYSDEPEKAVNGQFALSSNNNDLIIENPGFKAHKERIEKYTRDNTQRIIDLLLLKRQ